MSIIQRQVCDRHQQQKKELVEGKTRRIVIDGKAYEADECTECAAELDDAMAIFLAFARRVPDADTKRRAKAFVPIQEVPALDDGNDGKFYCLCGRGFGTHRGLKRHVSLPPANSTDKHRDTYAA